MPRFDIFEMTPAKHDALVAWIEAEGLDPSVIAADGRFSVHNGWVSGNRYLFDDDGKVRIGAKTAVTVHFRKTQATPLPPELEN